jgi:protease-4
VIAFLKRIFSPFVAIIGFINNHFKGMLFLLLLYVLFASPSENGLQEANLMSIDIHGAIEDARPVLEQIETAKNDATIQGVLLHVNSPGGGLAPSVELMMAVRELQEHKPVVAYGAGTMASGGYYAAIWAEHIVANPGAFIGSIGVLFQAPNIKPLADKLGIKEQVIQAGKYKQMGTFTRAWTKEEREALTHLIDEAYEMFAADVIHARNLNPEDLATFGEARLFLAHEAMKVGLIDELGSLSQAKTTLETLSGVQVPKWKTPSPWEKALARLGSEVRLQLHGLFYGFKAY